MRLENHPEILETAFKKEFVGRHPVEEDAIKDGALHTTFGQVFHQQREVVAEVQVGLARRVLRQGAATDVIDPRLRAAIHLVARVFQAPTQVDFLHVSEEAVVQSADLMI